jgi:hypothetical protein
VWSRQGPIRDHTAPSKHQLHCVYESPLRHSPTHPTCLRGCVSSAQLRSCAARSRWLQQPTNKSVMDDATSSFAWIGRTREPLHIESSSIVRAVLLTKASPLQKMRRRPCVRNFAYFAPFVPPNSPVCTCLFVSAPCDPPNHRTRLLTLRRHPYNT